MSCEPIPKTADHTVAMGLWPNEADCSPYKCPPYDAAKELQRKDIIYKLFPYFNIAVLHIHT